MRKVSISKESVFTIFAKLGWDTQDDYEQVFLILAEKCGYDVE